MSPPRYIFRRQRRWYSSPIYVFSLVLLILAGLFVTQGFRRGEMKPLFQPTPTPTRVAYSYAQEAETHFRAGSLDAAIASYQEAIRIDPTNGRLYAEMARILTYSTESQSTEVEKQVRFDQAMEATQKAVELAPDDSTAWAVRAFTLDWYASFVKYILKEEKQGEKLLTEAEQSAAKAITLDETNVLAQVFRAEIMNDQMRWDQAEVAIKTALEKDPNLWDAHRVNGLFLESQGYYLESIDEFKRASELAPNMTFLYIKLGMAWRNQGLQAWNSPAKSEESYNRAIDYFDIAAKQNEQLGVIDPMPYLGIGRTYAQLGQFYAASRNMNKALQYNPYNPDVYAQLGMVYRQARNYEDAIVALRCSVRGCSPDDTCKLRECNPDVDPPITLEGMGLSGSTVVYYYTYASLLAGMYLPGDKDRSNFCTDSLQVITEIRQSSFGSDETIGSILNESESICRSMTTVQTGPEPTPTATGLPFVQRTPTPTPRP
jgi:tetratricopeptide (TPR) repeat protein